jgi:hypothetical protein
VLTVVSCVPLYSDLPCLPDIFGNFFGATTSTKAMSATLATGTITLAAVDGGEGLPEDRQSELLCGSAGTVTEVIRCRSGFDKS